MVVKRARSGGGGQTCRVRRRRESNAQTQTTTQIQYRNDIQGISQRSCLPVRRQECGYTAVVPPIQSHLVLADKKAQRFMAKSNELKTSSL